MQRQGDIGRLEQFAGEIGGGSVQPEALAVLLQRDSSAVILYRSRPSSNSWASTGARKEQKTWLRIVMSLLW
jgi:hypothetical protein